MRYDEVWSVPSARVEEFFRTADCSGCDVSVMAQPDRKLGPLTFPSTRVIIDGDGAEALHSSFSLAFLCGGA